MYQAVCCNSVIYRPPPSKTNGFKNCVFFKEWPLYLERHALSTLETPLVGDLNFHLDVNDDPDCKWFTGILESFGLKQHVQGSTHHKDHTLDVVITKDTSDFIIRSR